MNSDTVRSRLIPLKVALVYALIGVTWILFSDMLLASIATDPAELSRLQTYKGWFYIMATSLVLYALVNRYVLRIRRSEEELGEANQTLYSLIQASPVAIIALDPEGNVTLWNPAAERIFGWSAEETIGRPSPIVPEHLREEYHSLRSRALGGEVVSGVELQRRRKDGTLIDVSLSTAPLFTPEHAIAGTMVLISDITTRKRAEAALRESEERYRIVVETAWDAIITIDEESTILFANPAVEKIFGCRPEELLGQPVTVLMPQRMRQLHLEAIRQHIRTGERHMPWGGIELPGLHKSGREIPLEISYGEFKKEGRLIFVGFLRDITERKTAEESLRRSERKYRALFEESKDVVSISTPEGRLIDINPAGVELFGYASREELLGVDMARDLYFRPEERERLKKEMAERGFVRDFEIEMRRKNGDRLTVLVTATTVRDETGAVIAYRGFMRDITNQKKLEQQLIQAQKMEAVGKLAGGVAHDFNNILTAIISYGNLLQMSLTADDPSRTYIDQILALADRAAILTQSLLAFSRRQIMNPREVDLNEIIDRIEKILSRLIGEDVELRVSRSGESLPVMADVGQVEQVLMNLATNARDAMPEGGVLSISTEQRVITGEFVRSHGYGAPGVFALIKVSDTGVGMDEATRTRIFEPFFTTKEMGKGTGLGLAIVWGIVKQHNGYINVYSEPGKGTTFRIYLPLVTAGAGKEPSAAPLPALATGAETILVAEDETAVRDTTVALLEKFGYRVITAADGEEAVRKFGENRDDIQLLLFDVVMPKKNGREAYEAIRRLKPGIKVLFTSGYASDIMYKRGILEEGFDFISKPFTPRDLLNKVREVLSREPAAQG
ncbi:MAG: PAS domain S-box protein [Nitrospirota bacterium]